jgi:2'-5' RNA ligase
MSDATPPQSFRLFIALTMPEDVKTEIEKAQAELRRALPKDCVRWTKREQFHLTLKFLGNVDAQRFEPLADAVRGACQGFAALDLRAERIGFFPDLRLPRVVWAGVRDQREQLPRLQRAVEASTRDFSAEESSERFTGHVTLGRIKAIRRPEAEALAKVASGLAARFFGAWTADKIEIIRSQLSPDGARHTTLATVPLAMEK